MSTLDEQIAQALREADANGELRSAAGWGKPLDLADGYAATPPELRMGYKALKDAGFVPPEVETLQQIAALRRAIEADPDGAEAPALRRRAAELSQHLALRLEKLARTGTL